MIEEGPPARSSSSGRLERHQICSVSQIPASQVSLLSWSDSTGPDVGLNKVRNGTQPAIRSLIYGSRRGRRSVSRLRASSFTQKVAGKHVTSTEKQHPPLFISDLVQELSTLSTRRGSLIYQSASHAVRNAPCISFFSFGHSRSYCRSDRS